MRLQQAMLVFLFPLVLAACGDPAVKSKPQPPVVSDNRIVFTQDSPQLAAFAIEKAGVRDNIGWLASC